MTKAIEKPSEDDKAPTGRYRKVEVRTWGDEKFRALTPIPACGQGLWLYLLTGPHTGPIPGLFRAGRAGMAEELEWDQEAFDKALAEVVEQGMVKVDRKARVMWVPNAIRINRPESPNVVRSWRVEFDLIPECDLKREAYESLRQGVAAMGDKFLEAFDERISKPSPKPSAKAMANQEQQQEQEAGTGEKDSAPNPPPAPAPPPAPGPAADAAGASSKRGTRLSPDWTLPKAWGEWAVAKYPHWDRNTVLAIAGKFRNHWVAATKNATKLDWYATWQNWCDSGITQGEHPPPRNGAVAAQVQASASASKAARLAAAMAATGGAVQPAATALEGAHGSV